MCIIKKRKRIIIRIQQSTRIGKIHVASKYIFPSIVFHVFNAIIYYFFFLFNIKHVIRSFDLHKINVRRTIISNNPMYTYTHTYVYIYIFALNARRRFSSMAKTLTISILIIGTD